MGGFLHCSGRAPTAVRRSPAPRWPTAPGVACTRHRDPGRPPAPRAHGEGRVPRRLGGRGRALADVAHGRPAPRDGRGTRAGPRHPDRALRLLRRLRLRDGKWLAVGAIEPPSTPTCAGRSARSSGSTHQTDDDAVQDEIRAASARRSRRATATPGWRSSRRPTPAWRRSNDPELIADDPHFRSRGAFMEAEHERARPIPSRSRRCWPGCARSAGSRPGPPRRRHRHRRAARRRGPVRRTRSRRMRGQARVIRLSHPGRECIRRSERSESQRSAGRSRVVDRPRNATRPRRASSTSSGLRLHDVRLGGERQPALLGREGGERDHGRADRAADDDLGLVPAALLGAGPHRSRRSRCRCTST